MTFSDHLDVFQIVHGSSLMQHFSATRDSCFYIVFDLFMLSEVWFFFVVVLCICGL